MGLRPQPRAGYLERVAGRFEQPASLLLPPRVLPFRTRSPRAVEPETLGRAPRQDVGGLAPASPPAGSARGAVRLPQARPEPAPPLEIALPRNREEGVAAAAEPRARDLTASTAPAAAVATAPLHPASRPERSAVAARTPAAPTASPSTRLAAPESKARGAATKGSPSQTAVRARAQAESGDPVQRLAPTGSRRQPEPVELLTPAGVTAKPGIRASSQGQPREATRRPGGRATLSIGTIEVVVTPPPSQPAPLPRHQIATAGRAAAPPASRAAAPARLARGYLNSFGLRQG